MAKAITPAPKKEEPKTQPEKTSMGLIEKQTTALSTRMKAMIVEDSGAGSEGIGREDLAIPRIVILQTNSPQVNKRDEAYVEGASAGDFYNTLDNEAFDGEKGILFVPCSYRRAFIEWITREDGGGFVKDHGTNPSILDLTSRDETTGKDLLPNGHQIVTTAEYIGFLINEETGIPKQVVLSMTSTQLKASRKWNTMIQQLLIPKPDGSGVFNPAMFFKAYKLTTVAQSNDKGDWFGFMVETGPETLGLKNGEQIYLSARAFKKAIGEGKVKVAQEAPIEVHPDPDSM
jgi:hypothetical protein